MIDIQLATPFNSELFEFEIKIRCSKSEDGVGSSRFYLANVLARVSMSSLKIDEIGKVNYEFRPRTRKNEISDISPGQKYVIQMEMSDSEFHAHGMEQGEVRKRYCG